jgi:gluconate 2-dehydrogenase gamma chain
MITRRDLLKVVSAAGATAAVGARADFGARGHDSDAHDLGGTTLAQSPRQSRATPLESLSVDEADLLTAILDRLIPADALGPGAVEAGALVYIDRSLAGPLASAREAYRRGLAALERYAVSSRGRPFRELSPADQVSLLIDVESGGATGSGAGFDGSSAVFFALLKAHTWQGTFGDPHYGGNRNYIGWDLLGYPGVRTAVTADDQRLGARPAPLRQSAYDSGMFNR